MLNAKKSAWILFGTAILVLAAVQTQSQGPYHDAAREWYPARAFKNHPVQDQGTRTPIQTACRVDVRNNLKAPDSAEFQAENLDLVGRRGDYDCHRHEECSGGRFYVQTKAYALNSYNARLLHTFRCEVVCTDAEKCKSIDNWELR